MEDEACLAGSSHPYCCVRKSVASKLNMFQWGACDSPFIFAPKSFERDRVVSFLVLA